MSTVIYRRCLSRSINFINRTYVFQKQQLQISTCHFKYQNFVKKQIVHEPKFSIRLFSTKDTDRSTNEESAPQQNKNVKQQKGLKGGKATIFERFKQAYRDYWYVLVPVHLITSCGWLGAFYYTAKSGLDIASFLESMGFSGRLVYPFKDSNMGYIAITYTLYKIATPLRYTVTLGGTTISINYLKQWGYIKPVPKNKLKEMYNEKKAHIRETIQETRDELRQRKDQLKERKDNIIGDYTKFKKELKDIKHK